MRVPFSVPPGPLGSGSRPPSQVYADLIHSYNNAGEYSCCFTELQRDFVVSRPTKLKSLIRLVKHWYRQVRHTGGPPASGPGLGLWSAFLGGGGKRFSLGVGPASSYLYNRAGSAVSQELMGQGRARHLAEYTLIEVGGWACWLLFIAGVDQYSIFLLVS